MKLNQSQRELLDWAMDQRITATTAYKRAWLIDPTAKGYPKVDRALNRLERAETMEHLAEKGDLPLDARS